MTGVETAADCTDANGFCDTMRPKADHSAPVNSSDTSPRPSPQSGEGGGSPLRERMLKKVAYWKSLRTLTDEQEAAVEFWEDYLRRSPAALAAPREKQQEVSEPLQQR